MAKKVSKKKPSTKKSTTKKKTNSKKRSGTVAAVPTAAGNISEEQIRARAFEIYCSGDNPADPDADWLQAERELQGELVS